MSWMQVLIAVPVVLLAVVLVHDFLAGLSEERLWGRPFPDEEAALAAHGVDGGRPEPSRPGGVVPLAPVLKKAV
jgi:hypothetical protein